MINKTVYGYFGAGIPPVVAKVTGYTKTKKGDTYFAAKEIDTKKVWYLYASEVMPGLVPSYGPGAGWYWNKEVD